MFYAAFYRRIWPIMTALTPRWFSREQLKTVIAAAPRDDVEQSRLRILIVGAVLAYLFWHLFNDGATEPANSES